MSCKMHRHQAAKVCYSQRTATPQTYDDLINQDALLCVSSRSNELKLSHLQQQNETRKRNMREKNTDSDILLQHQHSYI